MDRLETRCYSSGTLTRGMNLASQHVDALVGVKTEPDEEEKAMELEMQAGPLLHGCRGGAKLLYMVSPYIVYMVYIYIYVCILLYSLYISHCCKYGLKVCKWQHRYTSVYSEALLLLWDFRCLYILSVWTTQLQVFVCIDLTCML